MSRVLVVVCVGLMLCAGIGLTTADPMEYGQSWVLQDALEKPTNTSVSKPGVPCKSPTNKTNASSAESASTSAKAAKISLASEKKRFDAEICGNQVMPSAESGIKESLSPVKAKVDAPTTSTTPKAAKTDTKPGESEVEITNAVETESKKEGNTTEHKVQKLPGNIVKEVDITKETQKVSPKETVTKTTEHEVVKEGDTDTVKNATVTEKETKLQKTPTNATVTKTLETKVIMDKEGKETGKETVSEKQSTTDKVPSKRASVTKTVENKVVKGDDMEAEVEGKEEPVIGQEEKEIGVVPPANTTVSKTVVEHKVIMDMEKEDDKPKKGVKIEKETETDVTDKKELETVGKINASALEKETGPKEVIVTQKKVEKFPDNETKEIVMEEKVEKLPSKDIVKRATVVDKITKDTEEEGEKPKKEVITKQQIQEQAINKTAKPSEAIKEETSTTPKEQTTNKTETKHRQTGKISQASNITKEATRQKIKDLKQKVQEVSEQIRGKEAESCIEEVNTEKSKGESKSEAKVEQEK